MTAVVAVGTGPRRRAAERRTVSARMSRPLVCHHRNRTNSRSRLPAPMTVLRSAEGGGPIVHGHTDGI